MAKRNPEEDAEQPVKQRKKCRSNEDVSRASFLGIPTEIRNQVYELLLVKRRQIHVDPLRTGCQLPALLRTCRQVREEASEIFLRRNRFQLSIRAMSMPASSHWLVLHHPEVVLIFSESPTWKNLMNWCKYFHSTGGNYFRVEKWIEEQHEPDTQASIALSFFKLVEDMKDAPWKAVDKALQLRRKVMDSKGDRWGWNLRSLNTRTIAPPARTGRTLRPMAHRWP